MVMTICEKEGWMFTSVENKVEGERIEMFGRRGERYKVFSQGPSYYNSSYLMSFIGTRVIKLCLEVI